MEPLVGPHGLRVRPAARRVSATKVEELVNAELAAARPIVISFIPRAEAVLDADLIRTKVNLIPESVPEIRVVDIVGLDKQADGGHPRPTHRRGRPDRGAEDRVQGQGQQAHPPPGGGRLMPATSVPALAALAGVLGPAGAGGGGVQRRGRLRACWPGRRTTSSGPTGPWRSRPCPLAGAVRAGRLPDAGRSPGGCAGWRSPATRAPVRTTWPTVPTAATTARAS